MRDVTDVSDVENHPASEIMLDIETPVVRRGRMKVLRSGENVLRRENGLSAGEVCNRRVQDQRRQEIRRRCQRAVAYTEGADEIDIPRTAVSDADSAANSRPALSENVPREADARSDLDG